MTHAPLRPPLRIQQQQHQQTTTAATAGSTGSHPPSPSLVHKMAVLWPKNGPLELLCQEARRVLEIGSTGSVNKAHQSTPRRSAFTTGKCKSSCTPCSQRAPLQRLLGLRIDDVLAALTATLNTQALLSALPRCCFCRGAIFHGAFAWRLHWPRLYWLPAAPLKHHCLAFWGCAPGLWTRSFRVPH